MKKLLLNTAYGTDNLDEHLNLIYKETELLVDDLIIEPELVELEDTFVYKFYIYHKLDNK